MPWREIKYTRIEAMLAIMDIGILGWGRLVFRGRGGRGGPIMSVLGVSTVFKTRECASSKDDTNYLAVMETTCIIDA